MLRYCGSAARFFESISPKSFGRSVTQKHGYGHRIEAHHHHRFLISTSSLNQCPYFNDNHHNRLLETTIPVSGGGDGGRRSSKIIHGGRLSVDLVGQKSPFSSNGSDNVNGDHKNSGDLLSGKLLSVLVDNLPPALRPYARLIRLDKPTGAWLLLLPCWWSISMSTPAGQLPPLDTMTMFALGAVLMRSAGCVINDIWDRKYDRNVERTKNRPLATKEISLSQSIALLSILLGSSLLILIQFDMNSILLGAASLALVASYPSFKRFTYYPQAVLGMTYSYGTLLGWSVNCNGHLQLEAVLPLYVAGICWTMIYDTIYAHQDREYDLVLGLKSTAIKFGSRTRQILNAFSVVMTVCLLSCGLQTEQTWPYYVSLAIVFGKLLMINRNLDIDSMASCVQAFKQNTHIGWILLTGIILSTLLKPTKNLDTANMDDQLENVDQNQSEKKMID